MENYIVSARKYRPQTFESVVGQRALTQTLKNAIASDKLAHAYLFCGPRGVGKTTCARIFAKTINCEHRTADGEACNECENCKAFNEGRTMNIFELDAASNNSINDIRAIIERVNIPPQQGRYKVFIIDEVHMLSQSAFNAFLKTLEEPPSYAIFIMATTEKHKVLPTILSRCQIFDFQRMDISDIVDHLRYVAKQEGIQTEDAALHLIADKADGGMRDALSIFDQVCSFTQGNVTYEKVIEDLNILDYDYYFRATDEFLATDYKAALLTLNEVLNKGFDAQLYIGGLSTHFRNLLMSRDSATLPLLEVSDDIRKRYHEQANRCKPKFLYNALKVCNECDLHYRESRNKRLGVELAIIELSQLELPDPDNPSGRRPTTRIKPLNQSNNASEQPPVGTKQTHLSVTPKPTATPPSPATTTASSTATSTSKTTAHAIRRSVSISKPNPNSVTLASANISTAPQPIAQPAENKAFKLEDVLSCWTGYCMRLPQEEAAMKGRMQILHPTLNEKGQVEVSVENEWVKNDLNRLRPDIESYLQKELHNNSIKIIVKLSEADSHNRPRSRQDLLQALREDNPAVELLCKELSLTLY